MSGCDTDAKKIFDEFIKSHKIIIMSTNGCPACVDAKKLLDVNNFKYSNLDLSDDKNEKLFYCLYDITRSHYVPQVFVNSKYIGGFKELSYLNHTGLLNDLYHH